jgi:hypothetical protein
MLTLLQSLAMLACYLRAPWLVQYMPMWKPAQRELAKCKPSPARHDKRSARATARVCKRPQRTRAGAHSGGKGASHLSSRRWQTAGSSLVLLQETLNLQSWFRAHANQNGMRAPCNMSFVHARPMRFVPTCRRTHKACNVAMYHVLTTTISPRREGRAARTRGACQACRLYVAARDTTC